MIHTQSGSLLQIPKRDSEHNRRVVRAQFPMAHTIGWSYYLQNIEQANTNHDCFMVEEINRTPEYLYWHRKYLPFYSSNILDRNPYEKYEKRKEKYRYQIKKRRAESEKLGAVCVGE